MQKSRDMEYRNEALFSNHFLVNRLTDLEEWKSAPVDGALRDRMRSIFEGAKAGLPAANEAQTENDLIRPILDLLGLHYDVQTGLSAWKGHRVPDYAVFPSDALLKSATPRRGTPAFWDDACSVIDAKSWSTGLDDVGTGGSGRTPAQQITEYMRELDHPWGVLTSGRTWRLYSRRRETRASQFFEIDLEAALYGDEDSFRFFVLVFGKAGLVSDPFVKQTFNDQVLSGSVSYAKGVGDRLRDRAFRTVEILSRGFARHEGLNSPTSEQLRDLYENSLVLLYRLLFVLSAEARGLLPMKNSTYRDHYSLTHIRDSIRKRVKSYSWSAESCDLYVRLGNLFRLIDLGDGSLGVPPYNGGLFDSSAHSFLRDSCCRDRELGEALFQLSFDIDLASDSEEAIDYRDIAPRHLGTIYEGLLEFRLAVANVPLAIGVRDRVEVYVPAKEKEAVVEPGELFLENDKGARRATGSYYTPDYIVDYIVENALSEPLAVRSRQVAEELKILQEAVDSAPKQDARSEAVRDIASFKKTTGDRLIDVRVLDPAMGSGHFLVAAMHHIADRVFTDPSFEASEDDPKGLFLRRRIAERCLFGVDFNPLAVELARLTIWLETVAPDRPLSFLDHHLKVGDSLIGVALSQVAELKPSKKAGGTGTFAESELHADLPVVIGKLVAIGLADARTHADIEEKEARLREAEALLVPYREVADLWTSIAGFGQDGDQTLLDELMFGIRNLTRRVAAHNDARCRAALDYGRKKSFFHWEIEFPEAFFAESGDRLPIPGFDAVVGNPPYEVLETRQSDFKDASGKWTPGGKDRYEARRDQLNLHRTYFRKSPLFEYSTAGGKLDYFRLFIERCMSLGRDNGAVGMIVPRSLLADKASTGVRRLMWKEASVKPVDAFPKDPPSCWVFPEAELAVVVFVARKAPSTGKVGVRVHPCRQLSEASFAEIEIGDSELLDPETAPIPILRPNDLPIVRRIYANNSVCRFKDVAPCRIGEINSEYGKPYMRDKPAEALLIRGRHVARFHIDESLRLGTEKRWIDEKSYLKSLGDSGAAPSRLDRVVKQAITDIEDPRRIIAGLCSAGRYVLDSCDFLLPIEPYSAAYVLGVMLSDVCEWRFRMTSSNNNVNGYEIDELPFPKIEDWKEPNREKAKKEVLAQIDACLSASFSIEKVDRIVMNALAGSCPRAGLHDVLSELVESLVEMRGKSAELLADFATYLRALPNAEKLPQGFSEGEWVALDETEFFGFLSGHGIELSVGMIKSAKKERHTILSSLRPLTKMSDQKDKVSNIVVHRLFGLTASEDSVIKEALPPIPEFLPPISSA